MGVGDGVSKRFKFLPYFYAKDKAPTSDLSCTRTCLVLEPYLVQHEVRFSYSSIECTFFRHLFEMLFQKTVQNRRVFVITNHKLIAP